MTYAVSNPPRLLIPRIGSGTALWTYSGTDAHGDVDAEGFFTNGDALGMKVDDIVIVVKTSATKAATIHTVSAVVAGGAATLSAAVFT